VKNKILLLLVLVLATFLRLYQVTNFPAGLNSDEAAIGYNAWSLIQTGKDEHGVSWPLVFRSFDDYKPPLYFYLVLPFVKLFGLSVLSVRLPSAIIGVLSVYLLYLLAQKLFSQKQYALVPLLSAFTLAISPWHLQFSRGGWEVNAATFFILLSVYLFIKSFDHPKYLFGFGLSAVASLYTYHSARLITPLLFVALIFTYFSDLKVFFQKKQLKISLMAITFSVILALPIASQMLSKSGQSRFAGVSVFADQGPVWQATNYRLEHQSDSLFAKTFHNRYFSYGLRLVQNYLSHYSLDFLFLDGDTIARSKTPETGQAYLFLVPIVFIGLLSALKLDSMGKRFTLLWFMIAPLAAALTYQSPHALRSENMVIPLSLITALGLNSIVASAVKLPRLLAVVVLGLLVFFQGYGLARYLHMYYVHYPKELPYAWQYGFSEIADYLRTNGSTYDHIVISDRYDQPYILIAFFLQYDPAKLQQELVMSSPDNYGFSTGRRLGKFEFRSIKYDQDKLLPNTLLVSADEVVDDSKVVYQVKSPLGDSLFKFISTK